MNLPVRYKLAICGFFTTFGALLTRNGVTIVEGNSFSSSVVKLHLKGFFGINFYPHYKAIVQMSSGVMHSTADFCPAENSSQSTNDTNYHAFDWSNKQRGLMLSSFFLGHALSVFAVGPLLKALDARNSITFILLSSAVLTIMFPWFLQINKIGYHVAFMSRLILGILQGLHLPAFFTFWGRWAPSK